MFRASGPMPDGDKLLCAHAAQGKFPFAFVRPSHLFDNAIFA
jgi:hypothetical protein